MTPWLARERQREMVMGKVTWVVLGMAFLVWLVLASAVGVWARTVFEHSARPGPTTLDQVAGVVLYKESGQRAEVSAQQGMQLFDGDEVATSFGSTAVLAGFDGSQLQMYPGTRLHVNASRIGRFNPAATQAEFALVSGAIRLFVPQGGDRAHTLRVVTPRGSADFVPGEYTVRISPDAMRVSVWDGHSDLADEEKPIRASVGQKLIVRDTGARVVDVLENVLSNGAFNRSFDAWDPWEDREQEHPDVPGHLEVVGTDASGISRPALHVYRTSERDAHNETGIRQSLDRDVAGSREIRLDALIRVDFASLSGGGYLGSEYPLMLRVKGHDRRGSDQNWSLGFYYANPEGRPTPNSQIVAQGVWTPVSLDLSAAFSQAASIDSIEILGAGHTFDAWIANVELLVD